MYAQVALNNPSYSVDRLFTYLVPDSMESEISVGERVFVPFGANNKKYEAVVVRLTEDAGEVQRVKKLLERIDREPVVSDEGFLLAHFMKERYLCTYYEALRLTMPPGLKALLKEKIIYLGDEEPSAQEELLCLLYQQKDGIYLAELEEQFPDARRRVEQYREQGLAEITLEYKNSLQDKFVTLVSLAAEPEEVHSFLAQNRTKKRAQCRVLKILLDNRELERNDLLLFAGCTRKTLTLLEQQGYVTSEQVEVLGNPYAHMTGKPSEKRKPTPEQAVCIETINRSTELRDAKVFLLHGVTGSGKTEVYLQTIEHVISCGRQAIMLVPEIALTPQMVDQFYRRFGDRVAVLHSGLTLNERYDQWKRIKNGEIDTVVGARSAVFAPLSNIGLIIVDEEHELSYKSEGYPRYDGIEIARYRAKLHGASLILASATPSIVSYYHALQGDYQLLCMHTRTNDSPLPAVSVVDLRQELKNGNFSPLSLELQEELRKNLERKEQTILFLNRRGYSTFVSCRMCGYVAKCPHCDISLTYHSSVDKLVCHYCDYSIPNYTVCPECGSKYIKRFGTGTQKIEEEVHRLFPQATTIRMDVDTTRKKFAHEKILNTFRDEKIDILIGTQMVSKGLDFPRVTLAAVLAADSAMYINDYRSYERAFSQIAQVCGRAGRDALAGRAVVQTYDPENYVIQNAREHDYVSFYESEIIFRKEMIYPPFCDIINIISQSEEDALAKASIKTAYRILREEILVDGKKNEILKVLAPGPAPLRRIKDKFRYRTVLKCRNSFVLKKVFNRVFERHYEQFKNKKVSLTIDVNPTSML